MNSSLIPQTSNNGTDFSPSAFNSFIYLKAVLLILGLLLNLYVVRLITTGARSGAASEFFALNLSVCEIFICLNGVPAILYVLLYNSYFMGPLHYIVSFFLALLSISRPCFQCCICVERYVAVVYPITFLKYRALRYRVTFSMVIWLMSLGICAISLFLSQRFIYCYIVLPLYLLLLSVKVFCSIAVLQALRHPGPGEQLSVRDTEANRMKKKAFCVILIILVCMVITYGPVVIFMLLFDSLSESQRWDGMSMYLHLLLFSGLVQPLLYLHKAGKLPVTQCF